MRQAESRLQGMMTGSRVQEIELAKASVNRSKTEYEWAKRDWERAQTLLESKNISASQYDQFKTKFEGSEALMRQADENLKLVHEGKGKNRLISG